MFHLQPCPRCGNQNEVGQRFCGSCGQSLLPSPEQRIANEERRIVTILFADLVGFTARAEKLDPEDVRAVLASYFALVRRQIESYGGTVEKFIGDAVMAVFGAPVAHGDDPERAVRAAIGILHGVGELTDPVTGQRLEVRVGVNTGETLVSLDAHLGEGEGMVVGDAVNTASRLQSAAAANTIMVGEETRRSTAAVVDYGPTETLRVKGREAPVMAWRVKGAARRPGERLRPDVAFVGRERELDALTAVWESVLGGDRPQLAIVVGLPGVGKSRLASEFLGRLRQSGAQILVGRSLPYGASGSYDAFAEQVRHLAGIVAGDTSENAVRKLQRAVEDVLGREGVEATTSHIATMLGLAGASPEAAENVETRAILFAAACRLVQGFAARRPAVLHFEDVQWADASMLDLVEALARDVDAPLLLLTTARPDIEVKRPRWSAGGRAALVIPLEALAEDQARDLVSRLLARAAGEWVTRTAEEISHVGEGNPLFIEELVASLAERSVQLSGELPTSIRAIIAARLDSVPSPERSLLLSASVVGKVFWDGALRNLGSHGPDLTRLLASLEERDLIRREERSQFEGHMEYSFKHVLIRDVAYAALPRAKRREAHARVAAFLEEMHAENDRPALLGHHWREAGDRPRAADYLLIAADRASRGWAKDEAVQLYRQALALVDEGDTGRRRELRLKLAVAQQMVYHLSDAESMARRRQE